MCVCVCFAYVYVCDFYLVDRIHNPSSHLEAVCVWCVWCVCVCVCVCVCPYRSFTLLIRYTMPPIVLKPLMTSASLTMILSEDVS